MGPAWGFLSRNHITIIYQIISIDVFKKHMNIPLSPLLVQYVYSRYVGWVLRFVCCMKTIFVYVTVKIQAPFKKTFPVKVYKWLVETFPQSGRCYLYIWQYTSARAPMASVPPLKWCITQRKWLPINLTTYRNR